MEFNIQKGPPTGDEISEWRMVLIDRKRRLHIQYMVSVLVYCAIIATLCWLQLGDTSCLGVAAQKKISSSWAQEALDVSLMLVALGEIFFFITRMHKVLETASLISDLEGVKTPSEITTKTFQACQQNKECNRYHLAVAAQGRALVREEMAAMIAWRKMAEQRDAERALRSGKSILAGAG